VSFYHFYLYFFSFIQIFPPIILFFLFLSFLF
jgi:hypothetical protein